MNNPPEMKKFVFRRQKGVCQDCGFFRPLMGDFDADHVRPLFEAYGDHRYWEPENVRLLCRAKCHPEKTKIDMQNYRRIYAKSPK